MQICIYIIPIPDFRAHLSNSSIYVVSGCLSFWLIVVSGLESMSGLPFRRLCHDSRRDIRAIIPANSTVARAIFWSALLSIGASLSEEVLLVQLGHFIC